ncbi:hypothetical protein [Ruegeria sp. HKCCA4008]|uniref:hypothetical protein n=1 Tax=Ruegeria sp. HKCCA4008 TaxID=2682999 RepID=UPI001488D84E|nr:hypothetical protein [Ruegeria sp. HKCCA4008]
MTGSADKETKGAWIVHHARKISMDVAAPAEYSILDESGKAAELLMRLGAADEDNLTKAEVDAIARSANLNVRTELPHYLNLLKGRRLIDTSANEVQVLGINTRSVLGHASDIFDDASPTSREVAAVEIGELASQSPLLLTEAQEYVGDKFKMKSADAADFLTRASEIGFVDIEGDDPTNTLLFNGNLFKRDSVAKSATVLGSLSSAEQAKLAEVTESLTSSGCLLASTIEVRLGTPLFEKLKAAGVLEVNTVSNENGEHAFVTLPGAFHKFVNPLIDDSFDMAKALVSALSYGMNLRPSSQGRILSVDWILGALISGRTIGPATAIGNDYRVLEQNRVVKLTPSGGGMYRMKLLKTEIGQLALEVLQRGDANAETINVPPSAPMSGYAAPEKAREALRRRQSKPSKRQTQDILSALRGGRGL